MGFLKSGTSIKGQETKNKPLTCLTVVHDLVVEAVEVFRVAREGHPIACHGVPAAHSEEATLVILTDQILQHRPVVDEGMQVPGQESSPSSILHQSTSM